MHEHKRRPYFFSCALIAMLCAAGSASATQSAAVQTPAEPETPAAWRETALSDLDAAKRLIAEHTPIPFDTEDPSYPMWLEQGHSLARVQAEAVKDRIGYVYALSRYINGFRDPHLQFKHSLSLPATRWPGFLVASRTDGAVVTLRDENDTDAPPLGARVVSCDGHALTALAEQIVFPFSMNPRFSLDRRRALSRLFIDRGNPFVPLPQRCRFALAEGEREIVLRWRGLPEPVDDFNRAYQAAATGAAAEFGVDEPAPGVYWIGVPTFSSRGDSAEKIKALIDRIQADAGVMRKGRAIVLDIRGNGGGNSSWADLLGKALFGDAPVRAARRGQNAPAEEWRVSAGNLAYWRHWRETVAVPQFGENSDNDRYARRTIEGLWRALERGESQWRVGPRRTAERGGLTTRRPRGHSPFPARVYVLSNGACASSCLDFADTILHIPGVRLIGDGTAGDGAYVEIRDEPLPSGLAMLSLPQKALRGADRGPFEAYAPDVAYDGAWDDASVRQWTMDLVMRETAGER